MRDNVLSQEAPILQWLFLHQNATFSPVAYLPSAVRQHKNNPLGLMAFQILGLTVLVSKFCGWFRQPFNRSLLVYLVTTLPTFSIGPPSGVLLPAMAPLDRSHAGRKAPDRPNPEPHIERFLSSTSVVSQT